MKASDAFYCKKGDSVLLLELYTPSGSIREVYVCEKGDGKDLNMNAGGVGLARAYIYGRATELRKSGYQVVALNGL